MSMEATPAQHTAHRNQIAAEPRTRVKLVGQYPQRLVVARQHGLCLVRCKDQCFQRSAESTVWVVHAGDKRCSTDGRLNTQRPRVMSEDLGDGCTVTTERTLGPKISGGVGGIQGRMVSSSIRSRNRVSVIKMRYLCATRRKSVSVLVRFPCRLTPPCTHASAKMSIFEMTVTCPSCKVSTNTKSHKCQRKHAPH